TSSPRLPRVPAISTATFDKPPRKRWDASATPAQLSFCSQPSTTRISGSAKPRRVRSNLCAGNPPTKRRAPNLAPLSDRPGRSRTTVERPHDDKTHAQERKRYFRG